MNDELLALANSELLDVNVKRLNGHIETADALRGWEREASAQMSLAVKHIAELRAALRLAAQSPEPFGWIADNDKWRGHVFYDRAEAERRVSIFGGAVRAVYTAPPQSASDDALREALEQIRTVCIDNAGDTVRHDLALKFIGKIASRALAAGEATKSDGGEERPASNPLSEVTHRPSDPHEPATVLTKGGEGPAYIGRPGDARNLYEDSARDTRPADVTVKELASSVMASCSAIWAHEARQIARALLDAYKIGAK